MAKQTVTKHLSCFCKAYLLPLSLWLSLLVVSKSLYCQVNLQTGSATFSLPMFNWQDSKSGLTTLIGLSYNSGSGLKVNDVASEVGTGWSLVAGGVITRMQVGEPDDQVSGGSDADEKDLHKYPNGYLYAAGKAYNGCPNALTKYPIYKSKNQLYKQYNSVTEDKQLDYFAFQFNGKSGMFVLNAAPNSPGDPTQEDIGLVLGDSKVKIKFQRDPSLPSLGIRTRIGSFTIQDVDGLIYKFSAIGRSQLLETKYCDKYGTYQLTQPKFERGKVYYQKDFDFNSIPSPHIINSWYLTEIKDPLTGRAVTFGYDYISVNTSAGVDFTYNQDSHYSTVTSKSSKGQLPRLGYITYPDGHEVKFNHNGKLRPDFQFNRPLTSVDIKYNGRYISKYIINTTYFILNRYGTPVSDYQNRVARLCLKSVQKIGPDLKEDSPPYIFDYYTGSNTQGDYVPPPFCLKKDIWGYYNGDNSTDRHGVLINKTAAADLNNDEVMGLCFLRWNGSSSVPQLINPKNGYAKNGLLRQIVYPTGGTLTYDYEQNKGYLNSQLQDVGGVHVSATSSTDGGYSNSCENPLKTVYNYVLDQSTPSSSLWGGEMPLNHITMQSHYQPEEKRYKWPIISGSLFGKCTYNFMYPGILAIEQATDLSTFMKFMETISPVLGIVGSVSTVLNAIQIICGSTGVLAIISLVIDTIVGLYTLFQSCFGNHTKDVATELYYSYDLNSVNPLPTQFKRVEVTESPGTAGKTVHEFTSKTDYPIWIDENLNTAFSSKQRFAPWAYGLPLHTYVKNQNGDIIKETDYDYDWQYAQQLVKEYFKYASHNGLYTNLISCNCHVTRTSSQKSTDYNDPTQYNSLGSNDMIVDRYGYYTGRVNLSKITERVHDEHNLSAFVETVTSYEYNSTYRPEYIGNYEVSRIRTDKSTGETIEKEIFYTTTDYSNDPVINTLVQNNIVALPIHTKTHHSSGTTANAGYISETRTEFVQLATGAIKPSRLLEKRLAQPVYDPSNVNYTEVKKFKYDAAGNLTRTFDEGGRVVSNLYDYDDKYVVATIVNADGLVTPNEDPEGKAVKVAYTSFETGYSGGWTLSGAVNLTNSVKVTGDRSYQMTAGSSTLTASGLNTNTSYRLTFWASGPVSVSGGGTQTLSGPALNGFTYYEYEFPTGVSSVSISGGAAVDEVRLYPKAARMSTVTYDPVIGKTSECDANNRITYYEYDDLGRMRFIKDEKRNIVKMYEYNSASKQNGCPGVYYSHYTDEVFTKNNCGAGYVGGEYHYTVPAGKYSSTISQEDADAQVQNELLSQGQAAANSDPSVPCLPLSCNDAQSIVVYPENCPIGHKGVAVTYTVPAGRYCTTEGKAAANQLALDEIEANAQAYANNEASSCVMDYDPDWEAEDNAPTQCMWQNGQAYIFIQATDVNPNSPTYGSHTWKNTGDPGNCPPPNDCTITYQNNTSVPQPITFTASNQSYSFTLPVGYSGLLNIPAGVYTVTMGNANFNYQICDNIYGYSSSPNYTIFNVTVDCNCSGIFLEN